MSYSTETKRDTNYRVLYGLLGVFTALIVSFRGCSGSYDHTKYDATVNPNTPIHLNNTDSSSQNTGH